ncbi:hypothetical protein QN366_17295 [Pseudomonas sp. CCC3.2]|uniref:hypothetical protein n=1 Tax=unclassified Pseudomonas TaxID=196821 RepID=UPI002AB5A329|nr:MULTISPECIES: hypothetical protein [unclassified Pseudomonas]MDY7563318.1 hypothetical protein [Pseudomonas sp. AB6]MEB0181809.1 hypothetical protein [Pseudomonas sp. CCC3.2]MEB0211037.1 hypothetical protein [Pseudomonas sp. AB6]
MKRTVLTGLFLTAALLASPVFAAEDLCGANLQTIKDSLSSSTNLGNDEKMNLEETQKSAMAAHKAGDEKKCIELTTKAIEQNDKTDTGNGEGGGSK